MIATKNLKSKFLIIFVLIVSVLFSTISFFGVKQKVYANTDPVDIWDGTQLTVSTSTFTQSGTQEDPFLVENAKQFVALATIAKKEINTAEAQKFNVSSAYFKLTTNINLNSIAFEGIGLDSYPFKANFDGDNHTISGFSYTPPYNYYSSAGLFNTTYGASIKNLVLSSPVLERQLSSSATYSEVGFLVGKAESSTIENIKINTSPTLSVFGSRNTEFVNVGGIVGNCYNSTIKNCFISNLNASIRMTCDFGLVCFGGISGLADQSSLFEKCYIESNNSVQITETLSNNENCVGGIVGKMSSLSIIDSCFSKFNSINQVMSSSVQNKFGGLVGHSKESSISNSYSINGLWEENTANTEYFGGLIGYAECGANMFQTQTTKFLTNCYFVANQARTYTSATAGALVGYLKTVSGANQNTITLQNNYYSFEEEHINHPPH